METMGQPSSLTRFGPGALHREDLLKVGLFFHQPHRSCPAFTLSKEENPDHRLWSSCFIQSLGHKDV
ncbi:hypothetical protein MHYP_G00155640 [Metynnis hypsauchen]